MRKSINEFNSIFSETEKLTAPQLCLVKGGGEDLRRNTSLAIGGTTITTTTTITSTTVSGTITLTGTITGTISGTITLKK